MRFPVVTFYRTVDWRDTFDCTLVFPRRQVHFASSQGTLPSLGLLNIATFRYYTLLLRDNLASMGATLMLFANNWVL